MHYYSFNSYLRQRFGSKVYKLALDGGFTCPNRDGTVGHLGCIFCSPSGSGDFAIPVGDNINNAIENAKSVVESKNKGGKYITYFQSYTGTYAPIERLRELYFAAIAHPDIEALSIATRPDCLPPQVLELIGELCKIKPVFIELGLQTVHPQTARYIRRGYDLPVFDEAVKRLHSLGAEVVVHMIIGLPGETEEMIYETADHIARSGADGIKLHLLHVTEGTALAEDYKKGLFRLPELDEYIHILEGCIRRLPPDMVIHRLTGDGAKRELIAPLWSGDKKRVLNAINAAFDRDGVVQGSLYK